MKPQTRIAFDMSSWLWTNLRKGKDLENGIRIQHEGKELVINSRHHGYDNLVPRMADLLRELDLNPIDAILVFEGANSKQRRLLIDPDYKASRGKKPEQEYTEFIALRDTVKTLWKELGAIAVTQDNAEGDDTLAWLAQNTEDDLIIATFDNDLAALNGVNQHGARITVWVGGMLGVNKYGTFEHSLITGYKALVGDSSDNIKGCIGFGPAAFTQFTEQYGYDGLQELQSLLEMNDLTPLIPLAKDQKANPLVAKIWDQAPQVIKSYNLARLRPEWVETMRQPLQWEPGMVRQLLPTDTSPSLKEWYGRARLVTASTFDKACAWALPLILRSREVSLDIETSSPEESDEWLARQGKKPGEGVDVFGSTLTGLGLTFGPNNQYTLYFTVDHAASDNIPSEALRQFIAKIPQSIPLVIQNVSFELSVLYNEWAGRQLDNGFKGFLPNVLDTALEASYVDENNKRGLKERSLRFLGYKQQTYDETTLLTGAPDELPAGGLLIHEFPAVEAQEAIEGTQAIEDVVLVAGVDRWVDGVHEFAPAVTEPRPAFNADGTPVWKITPKPAIEAQPYRETRRYKMNELSADHVFGYGADDPICTIALHNFYKLHMQLEHQWQVYLDVEIQAAYMHAWSFIQGIPCSVETINALSAEDDKVFDGAWSTLRTFLIAKGWEGTTPPVYGIDLTAAQVKEAWLHVVGKPMDTMMRTISKLAKFAEISEQPIFGELLARVDKEKTAEAAAAFTDYVNSHFKGEPEFNDGSPKQMQHLLYEVMGLPIRVRNKPTDLMKAAGKDGTPKTDALAIAYALRDATPEQKDVLDSLKLMAMVGTRRSLYYTKYPAFLHWKDGRLHPTHNQAAANTRRATMAAPNTQQMPKTTKIKGHDAKFRQCIVPHRSDAVVVSMDFAAQELRIIADYSKDPNMLACYIGDNRKDQHSLTGWGIARRMYPDILWTYEEFAAAVHDEKHPHHEIAVECRKLGKNTNFGAEFGAMAPKLAQMLLVDEEEAQAFLDAKEEMFPVASAWKETVVGEVVQCGYVRTKMGAVRHLRDALMSDDRWEASKAERQAVNFKVQGSAAEMTKCAEGRMWAAGIFHRYDAVCYAAIHDEVVASVRICDLEKFLPEMHACMVAHYGDMEVPVESSIAFGVNFYDQIEIGKLPTAEAIEKGLKEMNKVDELKEAA